MPVQKKAHTWNCEHGPWNNTMNSKTSFMEPFYFCWTGEGISTIFSISTIFRPQGDSIDVTALIICLLMSLCCCSTVALMLTCKFCWVQLWHSSQEIPMGQIIYQRYIGHGRMEEDKPYLGWFFQLTIVCNVMCSVCFSLDDFNSVFLESYMRSYMPLTSSRGIWISGYFPYNQLPKVKTLIICCQAVE